MPSTCRHAVFAGNVFVSLDPDVAPLAEFLGAAGPHIEAYTGRHEALGRVRWLLKGNWKLWHENFRDNYHPMYTHRTIGANLGTGCEDRRPKHRSHWRP